MRIYIASDHAGFHLKRQLIAYLKVKDLEVEDLGAYDFDEGDDYPDFVYPCAQKVALRQAQGHNDLGIVIGGSGLGEAIVANKVNGIRAAVFYGPPMEIARLAKEHNNANVLSLAARFLKPEDAKRAVSLWLDGKFEAGRHEKRIDKIKRLESNRE